MSSVQPPLGFKTSSPCIEISGHGSKGARRGRWSTRGSGSRNVEEAAGRTFQETSKRGSSSRRKGFRGKVGSPARRARSEKNASEIPLTPKIDFISAYTSLCKRCVKEQWERAASILYRELSNELTSNEEWEHFYKLSLLTVKNIFEKNKEGPLCDLALEILVGLSRQNLDEAKWKEVDARLFYYLELRDYVQLLPAGRDCMQRILSTEVSKQGDLLLTRLEKVLQGNSSMEAEALCLKLLQLVEVKCCPRGQLGSAIYLMGVYSSSHPNLLELQKAMTEKFISMLLEDCGDKCFCDSSWQPLDEFIEKGFSYRQVSESFHTGILRKLLFGFSVPYPKICAYLEDYSFVSVIKNGLWKEEDGRRYVTMMAGDPITLKLAYQMISDFQKAGHYEVSLLLMHELMCNSKLPDESVFIEWKGYLKDLLKRYSTSKQVNNNKHREYLSHLKILIEEKFSTKNHETNIQHLIFVIGKLIFNTNIYIRSYVLNMTLRFEEKYFSRTPHLMSNIYLRFFDYYLRHIHIYKAHSPDLVNLDPQDRVHCTMIFSALMRPLKLQVFDSMSWLKNFIEFVSRFQELVQEGLYVGHFEDYAAMVISLMELYLQNLSRYKGAPESTFFNCINDLLMKPLFNHAVKENADLLSLIGRIKSLSDKQPNTVLGRTAKECLAKTLAKNLLQLKSKTVEEREGSVAETSSK